MSITYTPTTNFGAKDSLPSNDPAKVIKGAEFTTEYTAIQSAFALAAPASNPTFTGTATFDDMSVTGDLTADGSVGIGTASPAYKLEVSASQALASISSTGSGNASRFFLFNTADNLYAEIGNDGSDLLIKPQGAERMRIDASGNVGIGTSSPTEVLQVAGTVASSVNNSAAGFKFGRDISTRYWQWTEFGSGAASLQNNSTSSAASVITVDTSGNVGIGETAPANARLVVQASGNDAYALRLGNDAGGGGGVQGITKLGFDSGASTVTHASAAVGVEELDASDFRAGLTFSTRGTNSDVAPTERMRIDSIGNVGIGVTSPSASLHVASNSSGGTVVLNADTAAGNFGTLSFRQEDGSTENGKIVWNNSALNIRTNSTAELTFSTGGSNERMRIDSSGNVGIGTDNPIALSSYKTLEIQGSADVGGAIRLTTSEGESGVLFNFNGSLYVQGEDTTLIGTGDGTSASNKTAYRIDRVSALHRWYDPSDGSTERMRIDPSGNVGIGTDSPAGALEVAGKTSNPEIFLSAYKTTQDANAKIRVVRELTSGSTSSLQFSTNDGTQLNTNMTIDSSGNLLVGKTTSGTAVTGIEATATGQLYVAPSNIVPVYVNRRGATGTVNMCLFQVADAAAGSIQAAAGGTPVFAAASDERLKDNIVDHESELANVMALRPTRWDWKDTDLGAGEGFIAQELEQTAWADLVSEGEDGYKQVAGLGAVETRLIKALQEAVGRIESLEAEVEALKNA